MKPFHNDVVPALAESRAARRMVKCDLIVRRLLMLVRVHSTFWTQRAEVGECALDTLMRADSVLVAAVLRSTLYDPRGMLAHLRTRTLPELRRLRVQLVFVKPSRFADTPARRMVARVAGDRERFTELVECLASAVAEE